MKRSALTHAFTLVELLIVMAIIGILATVVLRSFIFPHKRVRDTNRESDIKQYQISLEDYANLHNGLYPSRTDLAGADVATTLCTDLGETDCPNDPAGGQYLYQSDGSGSGAADATQYVMWASLEADTTDFHVACSNGKTGLVVKTDWVDKTNGDCPL